MPATRREITLGRFHHPDPLRIVDSGRELELIVDPVADRLRDGDPIFGWEGDERLALYLDRKERTWDLWRLEHDGVYRCCRRLACDAFTAADVVPELILWLVMSDTRRGFDPVAHTFDINTKAAAVRDAAADAFHEEAADRLAHGLRKDGVL